MACGEIRREAEETTLKKCITVVSNNGFSPTLFEIRVRNFVQYQKGKEPWKQGVQMI